MITGAISNVKTELRSLVACPSNMSKYNFKGNLMLVSQRQLEYIGEILEKRNIKGQDVLIEAVGQVGDNYIANVKRIIVEENGTTFKMVAKLAPQHEKMRQMANIQGLFHNEHIMYTEIFPKMRQLQLEAGLSKEERFRYPECYGSLSEAPHEVILLEDLKEAGFSNLNRFKPISSECVKLTLKNLAIFHSLSFALKHLEPETYNAFKSKLNDMMTSEMFDNDQIKMYFKGLEEMTLNCISDDEKYKKVIRGSVSEIGALAKKCLKLDRDSKHAVIRQGDGWTNNIMFKMNNDLPEEVCLIDYQLVYESSPVYDIMYMLFNSTDHEQRVKHYQEFIDYYHSELDKSLNNFGLKANFYYPRDQLDADLKRYAKFLFAMSIMISNVIIKKPEEAAVMKKTMEDNEQQIENGEMPSEFFEQDPETFILFKKRVEDLVDSYLDFGLLSL